MFHSQLKILFQSLVLCKVLREMTSVFGGHMSDGHLLALSTKARIPIVFRFIIEYSSLMIWDVIIWDVPICAP
jgi:hypothetical protein